MPDPEYPCHRGHFSRHFLNQHKLHGIFLLALNVVFAGTVPVERILFLKHAETAYQAFQAFYLLY